MADEVELNTFTVTLLKQPSLPGAGPGVPLRDATFEEAHRAFSVDLPLSLPGGFRRTGIAMGTDSQPVLMADYALEWQERRAYLSYILVPSSVYEPAPDGKLRYMVIADSMERKLVGGRVVAMARQAAKSRKQPGGLTMIWEKEGHLALAVADGLTPDELEAAILQIA
jgi:hypothetical protein